VSSFATLLFGIGDPALPVDPVAYFPADHLDWTAVGADACLGFFVDPLCSVYPSSHGGNFTPFLAWRQAHDGSMTWYGTSSLNPTAVHARPDCPKLHLNRRYPVQELSDDQFEVGSLCKVCFKGQQVSLHARCSICGHRRVLPCPHNGAVLVLADDGKLRWRWPEFTSHATLVHPMQLC